MQVTSLLNILASSPAILAAGVAKPGQTLQGPVTQNGLPGQNTGSLADALLTAQTATPEQFAGLLNSTATIKPLPLPLDATPAKPELPDDTTTPGDTAPNPATQTNSIAVPPIGLYIDQQPIQNVVLKPDDTAISDATSGKKLVFADNNLVAPPAPVTRTPLPAPVANPVQANEIYNQDQNPVTVPVTTPVAVQAPVTAQTLVAIQPELKPVKETEGKIKLAGLETTPQDPEFQKAFANIIEQAKGKSVASTTDTATTPADAAATTAAALTATNTAEVKKADIHGKLVAANTNEAQATSNADTKSSEAQATLADEALTKPQQAGDKIISRVLGVKEDKINLDTDMTPEMSAKLQDLDAQLRSRSYTQIKAATAALPQTAAEQVQVKISQAIASGDNTIKINLHPAELGAVDVDMNTDKDGNTKIRIIADKAETLQMLQHDSKHLIKSLTEVGMKADSNNLEFSLRGGQQNQQNFAQAQNDNNNFNQPNQQQANAANTSYSRFSKLNEQDLILSINNKALNILV